MVFLNPSVSLWLSYCKIEIRRMVQSTYVEKGTKLWHFDSTN